MFPGHVPPRSHGQILTTSLPGFCPKPVSPCRSLFPNLNLPLFFTQCFFFGGKMRYFPTLQQRVRIHLNSRFPRLEARKDDAGIDVPDGRLQTPRQRTKKVQCCLYACVCLWFRPSVALLCGAADSGESKITMREKKSVSPYYGTTRAQTA